MRHTSEWIKQAMRLLSLLGALVKLLGQILTLVKSAH